MIDDQPIISYDPIGPAQAIQKAWHLYKQKIAYKLWEKAGCPDGRADEFWFEAEATLKRWAVPNTNSEILMSPEAVEDIKNWPEPSTDPQPFTKRLISLAKLVTRRQGG